MKKLSTYFYVWIFLLVIVTGCAAPLKIKPAISVAPPTNLLTQGYEGVLEDQLKSDKARYTITLPQEMESYQCSLHMETGRLYLMVKEKKQYKVLAIDVPSSALLWSVPLPLNTNLYAIGETSAGDVYLDLNHNGHAVDYDRSYRSSNYLAVQTGNQIYVYVQSE